MKEIIDIPDWQYDQIKKGALDQRTMVDATCAIRSGRPYLSNPNKFIDVGDFNLAMGEVMMMVKTAEERGCADLAGAMRTVAHIFYSHCRKNFIPEAKYVEGETDEKNN